MTRSHQTSDPSLAVKSASPITSPTSTSANTAAPAVTAADSTAAAATMGQPLPPHIPATKLPTPPPQQQGIETNPDYIALTSALTLLQNQRSIACKDLVELQRLKSEALSNPQGFLQNLQQGSASGSGNSSSRIPKMQRVVKAPLVSWQNYGIQGQDPLRQQSKGIMDNHPSFSSVRLFDNE